MTTYSAFFSSGLLAPHNTFLSNYSTHFHDPFSYYDVPSPASSMSTLPIQDDSDVEIDADRQSTPTPEVPPLSVSNTNSNICTTANTIQPRPRLRKRRSSFTVATSPMNAIRSPARTAGAALQLQMHLPSPSRSRSGSLSTAAQIDVYENIGIENIATESTSLVGRMRSGSVGGSLRPRRAVRRLASVPAPAPPPTAPLPAIPNLMLPPPTKFAPHSAPLNGAFPHTPQYGASQFITQMNAISRPPRSQSINEGPGAISRDRSYSIENGYRIEEMKEN